jgi:hypothetical protein
VPGKTPAGTARVEPRNASSRFILPACSIPTKDMHRKTMAYERYFKIGGRKTRHQALMRLRKTMQMGEGEGHKFPNTAASSQSRNHQTLIFF